MKLKQADIIKLSIKFDKNRVAIQQKLDTGATFADLAKEENVSVSTIRSVCHTLGLERLYKDRAGNGSSGVLFSHVLIVLARIAAATGTNHDEIKPYL